LQDLFPVPHGSTIQVSSIPNFDPMELPFWQIYQQEGKDQKIQSFLRASRLAQALQLSRSSITFSHTFTFGASLTSYPEWKAVPPGATQ